METIIITEIDELEHRIEGEDIYIYGAKKMAIKLHKRLTERKIHVQAFLVSQKYDNPYTLQNIRVLRIEQERDKEYSCVIVAMGTNSAWKMDKELKNYNVKKLIIIHPALINDIWKQPIISSTSKVSSQALIDDNVDITVDDTSTLEIAPYVYIGKGTKIHLTNHSEIKIDTCTRILDEGLLYADSYSKIWISKNIRIGEKAHLEGNNGATIELGADTTVGRDLVMTCAESNIIIGDDNMLSVQIKAASGMHKLHGGNKKHRKDIITKNHVWIGMGAALLPGTCIGANSVVGANSLVNSSVPSNSTCGGNPVRILSNGISWNR